MQEIVNKNEKPIPEKHIRHIFLFNDLLVVTISFLGVVHLLRKEYFADFDSHPLCQHLDEF